MASLLSFLQGSSNSWVDFERDKETNERIARAAEADVTVAARKRVYGQYKDTELQTLFKEFETSKAVLAAKKLQMNARMERADKIKTIADVISFTTATLAAAEASNLNLMAYTRIAIPPAARIAFFAITSLSSAYLGSLEESREKYQSRAYYLNKKNKEKFKQWTRYQLIEERIKFIESQKQQSQSRF